MIERISHYMCTNFYYVCSNIVFLDQKAPRTTLNTLLTHALIPTITKPTRITHRSATLIDNIYLKMNTKITARAGILITDLSDHMPVTRTNDIKKKGSNI